MMTLYEFTAVSLFSIGLYGFFDNSHIIKKILSLNILGQGIFLLFITFSQRASLDGHDPIPHAMVLTGIVVAVCATSMALYLALKLFDLNGATSIDKIQGEEV